MKTVLAATGALVLMLAILGAFGVGHFVIIYSAEKVMCEAAP